MRSPVKCAVVPWASTAVSCRKPAKASPAVTSRNACAAGRPALSRSRTRSPNPGSVTFWVATAPTPARTQGQRLPTQMLDVVMPTPSIPVREHRATMEKVMLPCPWAEPMRVQASGLAGEMEAPHDDRSAAL